MMTTVRMQPIHSDHTAPRTPRTRRSPGPARCTAIAAGALALFTLAAIGAQPARAQGATASCSFLEIQATNDGQSIDKQLSKLQKKLKQPPFSSWSKFSLLKKHDRALTLQKTDKFAIGSSSKLQVEYKEYTRAKKERFKLHLTLQRKNGKKAVNADFTVYAGDYLVLSLSPKRDHSYLLAVTCKK